MNGSVSAFSHRVQLQILSTQKLRYQANLKWIRVDSTVFKLLGELLTGSLTAVVGHSGALHITVGSSTTWIIILSGNSPRFNDRWQLLDASSGGRPTGDARSSRYMFTLPMYRATHGKTESASSRSDHCLGWDNQVSLLISCSASMTSRSCRFIDGQDYSRECS